jgi:DHA1 family tetracycline resistance protein-like MFS transporter
MRNARSPLFLIWVTVFVDLVGFGMIIPILPLYAERQGASEIQVGLLLASYSLMQFIFAPILGAWSDRVGRKPVLAASLYGTAIASIAMGVASGIPGALWLLFVARIVDGITGANIAAAQAYVADVTSPEKRARGLGLIGMAFGLGFVLGPAIGGLLATIDVSLPFYVVGAVAAANATAMLVRLPEPERRLAVAAEARSRIARLTLAFRDPRTRLLLVVVLLATTAFAAMEATLALLLKDRFGYDESSAAYCFAFVGIVMAAVQGGLVGRLVERVGERPLIVFGLLLLTGGLALLGVGGWEATAILLAALALLAVGTGIQTPAVTSLVSRLAPASAQGTTLGVTQSTSSIGRIVGPVAGTALYAVDLGLPYLSGAAVMAAALCVALYYNAGDRR